MDLYKFITNKEIKDVSENIKNKADFEIERKYKEYKFLIGSSRAGIDFEDGTKEGDYIIGMDFTTTDRGWGIPISGERLKGLEDENKLRNFIDKELGRSRIEGYETIGKGQASIFEMMIKED